jgi:monofunctional biosynthetic peptidoglycan transglycosylase
MMAFLAVAESSLMVMQQRDHHLRTKHILTGSLLLLITGLAVTLVVAAESAHMKMLYDFTNQDGEKPWNSNNDGVMGGLSQGSASLTREGMEFSGILSLENNGGFSSIEKRVELDLTEYRGIRLKVRGDGRTYQLRLNSDARYRDRWPVSYSGEFETKAGEWLEVSVPFDQLRQSWRGRALSGYTFNPATIERIGILLGDKKAGPFQLEIKSIAAYTESK